MLQQTKNSNRGFEKSILRIEASAWLYLVLLVMNQHSVQRALPTKGHGCDDICNLLYSFIVLIPISNCLSWTQQTDGTCIRCGASQKIKLILMNVSVMR